MAVWEALFLREALTRLTGSPRAWLWLMAEPLLHIGYIAFIYSAVKMNTIQGMSTLPWIMVALLGFLLFRRTFQQASKAPDANKALFTYRQVKPVDTVLVRALLEAFVMLFVIVVAFAVARLSTDARAVPMPDDALGVCVLLVLFWTMGCGLALITAVLYKILPAAAKSISMTMLPLYFLSGVMYPISVVPHELLQFILVNPLIHGVELLRAAYGASYMLTEGVSFLYFGVMALSLFSFGLILFVRYRHEMIKQ